ncbi:MAG: exonuclease SbcCD subunit D C-terminal domain-containing protein [Burkholderiaceae bacterium]|nr:exonuclease SbcCD subunit D C-terminal domain-containing protein [Burkholderiaceae bacterium]
MRILHTSDWHLGLTLRDYERSYEHECFLDWLLDTAEHECADALLIAGDIFDNANPSSNAQRQLYRFLQRAKARMPRLDIVLIAGNHDSPSRLEAPQPLLGAMDIAVVGQVARKSDGEIDANRLVVPLTDASGVIRAWCLAIPYLRPGDVPRVTLDDEQGRLDPYAEGVATLYQQVLDVALAKRSGEQAIIAMGHCHMVGGKSSADSERPIVIGGVEGLPSAMFDPALAYVALGHLHLAQTVGGDPRVRYSGSPLPMSFSEIDYAHQILRIDLDGSALRDIASIPIPRAVNLIRVPPYPKPVADVLDALNALDLEDLPVPDQPFLEVRIQLDGPEPGLRGRVEQALAGKPVRLARIETVSKTTTDKEAFDTEYLERLQPLDVFVKLYQRQYGSEAPADLIAAFNELADSAATEEI